MPNGEVADTRVEESIGDGNKLRQKASFVAGLFFLSQRVRIPARGWLVSGLLAILLFSSVLVFFNSYIFRSYKNFPGGHPLICMDMAISRVLLGEEYFAHRDSSGKSYTYMFKEIEKGNLDFVLRDVPVAAHGSIDAYKKDVAPFVHNEMALQYFMEVPLFMFNDLTYAGYLIFYQLVAIGCFAIVSGWMVKRGMGIVCSSIFFYGSVFFVFVNFVGHGSTQYLMVAPLLLLLCIGSVELFALVRGGKYPWAVLSACLLGVFFGFVSHWRTATVPVAMAVMAIGFASMFLAGKENVSRKWIVGVIVFFLVGVYAYKTCVVKPIAELNSNRPPSHVLVHNVLIGLANIKDSPLVKREGIAWSDAVGYELAKRIDPDVGYLGARYEKAQLAYYLKLWLMDTDEMLDIYKRKFMVTMKNQINNIKFSLPPYVGGSAEKLFAGAFFLLLLPFVSFVPYGLLFVSSFLRFGCGSGGKLFGLFSGDLDDMRMRLFHVIVDVCCVLLFVRLAIIYNYSPIPHGITDNVFMILFVVMLYQVVADVLYVAARRALRLAKPSGPSMEAGL